jgi:ABC-type uncharacterized transport system involved in gliding motility auxiliary subunit
MMDTANRNLFSAGSIALLAFLFVALVILSGSLLKGLRLDLTSNKQYTLSPGTVNILGSLEEPVNLYLFFSEEASRDLPQIRSYAKWVGELLDEMADRSSGGLTIHRIDPRPFSGEEDQANQFGLQAVPVGATGQTLYFGLAGTNTLDGYQAIPFLQPSKEAFLEYDLAKMIATLSHPGKKKLGLLSSLGMQASFDPATQQMRPAWTIHEQLEQFFDIVSIDATGESLPQDIDLLFLVHPKALSESMRYQVDQFVLGGGRLVAFLDPYAEADLGDNPSDPMARFTAGSSSTLPGLLDAWGVRFDGARMIGDLAYAMQVGMGGGAAPVRHLAIMSVSGEGLNAQEIVSADLEAVNFSSSGWFEPVEDATTSFDWLVQTSQSAAPLDATRMRFLSNPADLMSGFEPSGNAYTLAVRISGPARSAFEEAPAEASMDEHLAESGAEGIQVLLFADTDMLTDRFWVQRQNFLGQQLVNSFADNGNLVINAVDHMLGSSDLISIRTRATTSRPFERVEELRLAAETRYRDTEEQLQLELQETERKLTEMQSARSDVNLAVLSSEQSDEIQRFLDQRARIRADLRQVQHDLGSDIEALGTRLKLFNIVLVPALVVLFALFHGHIRRQRRESAK